MYVIYCTEYGTVQNTLLEYFTVLKIRYWILYVYKTQNLKHNTVNGQYVNSTEAIFLLFLFHYRDRYGTGCRTQDNHNNTTTQQHSQIPKIPNTKQQVLYEPFRTTMNGYNYSVRPLSLHLFCWNLTQHHRPVVLSVSLFLDVCCLLDRIVY